MLATPAYDVALILNQGQRETQEDAIAARMFDASDAGYVVIADGMGGHEAGEIASEMVVAAWRDALDAELEAETLNEGSAIDALPLAAMQANAAIANYTEARGGGSTWDRPCWVSFFWGGVCSGFRSATALFTCFEMER